MYAFKKGCEKTASTDRSSVVSGVSVVLGVVVIVVSGVSVVLVVVIVVLVIFVGISYLSVSGGYLCVHSNFILDFDLKFQVYFCIISPDLL
tara:strand:- start:151 stop:423 length:273 start_codon:yes stop_codon:yes gene_type:complete